MLGDFIHNHFDKNSPSKFKKKQKNQGSAEKKRPSPLKNLEEKTELLPEIDHGSPHSGLKYHFKEFIGHLNHTPEFLKYNPFLHTGYRINFNTPGKVVRSLFMLHNESVNIWTHLCGGIALMLISFFLCFSVNSFDSDALKIFVKHEVGHLFKPIYHSMPNFTQIELEFSDKVLHTKEDIVKFGENTIANFETTLHSITEEIEHVKENLNPEAIGKFLNKLKDELDGYSNKLEEFKNSVFTNEDRKNKIKEMTIAVENKLEELQGKLINKIDSSAFDWVDIYRFVCPSYANNASEDGYRRVPISRWPIIVFLISAVFCLMCSAIYHAFHCLSNRALQILSRLDYAGISLLITGSCFPPFVYGFYCQPFLSQMYLTCIGVTSVIVFIVSLGDKIHRFEYSTIKSCMYGGLVFFAVLPCVHLTYLNFYSEEGTDNLDFLPSIPYYLGMILFYLIGLIIYATKYPEKCCPGKFDLIGHSHQIWHICVLLGIIFTYFGAFNNYYTRIKIPCIGCDL